MDKLDREIFRDKQRNAAFRRLGTDKVMCLVCGEDDPEILARGQDDHIAGVKFACDTVFLCLPCHIRRTALQRAEPKGAECKTKDPRDRNPLEVIGRWLCGIAQYFELLRDTLWRFGNFLIELARQGYGSELAFPD